MELTVKPPDILMTPESGLFQKSEILPLLPIKVYPNPTEVSAGVGNVGETSEKREGEF